MKKLQICVFNHPQFVNSPLINYRINIKDNITGEGIKKQKITHWNTHQIITKWLNKTSTRGWFWCCKVWIRWCNHWIFILKMIYASSYENMSNHHKIMCGCEIFISASMIKSELNAWISSQIEKLRSVSERSNSIISGQERRKTDG